MSDPKPVLEVVVASTRPGRMGPPFMDGSNHPKLGQYLHQHTLDWSATVSRADAFVFVFVTPEYNYGYNAALKNAIDYLHTEWADKPVRFVGYGGIGAGTRAIQQLKQVVTTLRMVRSSSP